MFFNIEKSEERTFNFSQNSVKSYKIETRKIINFLSDSRNEESIFATKNGML